MDPTYACPADIDGFARSQAEVKFMIDDFDESRGAYTSSSNRSSYDTNMLMVGGIMPVDVDVRFRHAMVELPTTGLPNIEPPEYGLSPGDAMFNHYTDFSDAYSERCPSPTETISRFHDTFEARDTTDTVIGREGFVEYDDYCDTDSEAGTVVEREDDPYAGIDPGMKTHLLKVIGPRPSRVAVRAAANEIQNPDNRLYDRIAPKNRSYSTGPFPCLIRECSRSFKYPKYREHHMDVEHFKGRFICPGICGEFYSARSEVKTHCQNSSDCGRYFNRDMGYEIIPTQRWRLCNIRYLERPKDTDPFYKTYMELSAAASVPIPAPPVEDYSYIYDDGRPHIITLPYYIPGLE